MMCKLRRCCNAHVTDTSLMPGGTSSAKFSGEECISEPSGVACRPLKQLLAMFLARQPGEVAAAVRTTVAVTGVTTHPAAGNVIPSLATAQFNFRYLPGQRHTSHECPWHARLLHDEHASQNFCHAFSRIGFRQQTTPP